MGGCLNLKSLESGASSTHHVWNPFLHQDPIEGRQLSGTDLLHPSLGVPQEPLQAFMHLEVLVCRRKIRSPDISGQTRELGVKLPGPSQTVLTGGGPTDPSPGR